SPASMDSLSSSGVGDGGGSDSDKRQILEQLQQQTALNLIQSLVNTSTEKCFEKCVPSPGGELATSEQKCVSMCLDRYVETWNIVSKVYGSRIARESGGGGGGSSGISFQ
ncbi:hypothetical protein BOX15_Mlig019025g1, partial [Macrostomum lignano]